MPTKLTEDERAELAEIGASWRHDDVVTVGISTVAIPLMTAALATAWQRHDLVLPLFLGAASLWVYWMTVQYRRRRFTQLRFERARELEEKAGLSHHVRIAAMDRSRKFRWRNRSAEFRWGIRSAEWLISVFFFAGWMLLLGPPVWILPVPFLGNSLLRLIYRMVRIQLEPGS